MVFELRYMFPLNLIIDWIWTQEEVTGTIPSARRGHTCVYSSVPSPCLIVFGGICGYNTLIDDACFLDLEKKKWAKIAPNGTAPPPMAWHTATVIKQNMFVIGGLIEREKCNPVIYALHLNNFTWVKIDLTDGTRNTLISSRACIATLFSFRSCLRRLRSHPRWN